VDVPESSARGCVPAPESTLCSLNDFTYSKIANTAFAQSGSPAAALVYNYHLTPADADNILEIVALSGYEVHRQDVSAWINTHEDAWKAWIP
jgi:glycine betaine/proline transport system substrate-binding protein